MIEYFVRQYMNDKINGIAKVLELKLKQGHADLIVKLKGETEPLNVSLDYALEGDFICISNVKTSKEWLNALAEMFKEKYSKIYLGTYAKPLALFL